MVDRKTANTLPAPQRIMALLSLAGTAGMPFGTIASMVKVPPPDLRALLDALVGGGEVAVSRTSDGVVVYRRLL